MTTNAALAIAADDSFEDTAVTIPESLLSDADIKRALAASPLVASLQEDADLLRQKAEGKKTARDLVRALTIRNDNGARINPMLITVLPGFNPRKFDKPLSKALLLKLADDIRLNGVHTAVKLSVNLLNGTLELRDGGRRFRATMIALALGADIRSIPIEILPHRTEAQYKALTNAFNTGEQFDDEEKIDLIKELEAFGYTEKMISDEARISVSVQRRLKSFDELPDELKSRTAPEEGKPVFSKTDILHIVAESPTLAAAIEKVEAREEVAVHAGAKRATRRHDKGDFEAMTAAKFFQIALRTARAEGFIDRTSKGKVVITMTLTDDEYDTAKKLTKLS